MKQAAARRSFAKLLVFCAQLFAFIPFDINTKISTLKRKRYYAIYPSLFLSIYMIGLFLSITTAYPEARHGFESATSNGIVLLMSFLYILTLLFAYAEHYTKLQLFEEIFHEFVQLIRTMIHLKIVGTHRSYAHILALGVFHSFLPVGDCIAIWLKFRLLDPDWADHVIQYTFIVLPTFSISIMPNLFYVFTLVVFYLFREINEKLRIIVNGTIALESCACHRHQKFRMQKRLCDLSDTVDAIAEVHLRLCLLAGKLNDLMMINLSLWTVYKVVSVVLQLFTVYLLGVAAFKYPDNKAIIALLWSFVIGALVSSCEGSLLSAACEFAMRESRKGVQIVHEHYFTIELDVRFTRSLDQLSMQIIQHKLAFNSWGMYLYDYALIYTVISTGISYLIILIQFELSQIKQSA